MTVEELKALLASVPGTYAVVWKDINFGGKFDDVEPWAVVAAVAEQRLYLNPPIQDPLDEGACP